MLDPELTSLFLTQKSLFQQIMELRGDVYRELENRRTQRVTLNHKNYFLKQHFGTGWKEIFKNLIQGKLPVVSAKNEWMALKRMQELNISVPLISGYGCEGFNPATRQSFLLTHEIPSTISLEDACKNWKTQSPDCKTKRALITEVARIARVMHENGVNHRDFYLCHFLLDSNAKLSVIDWHRAQIRKTVPERWIIKDLAGLYFSSKDAGLTRRDLLRFIKEYRKKPLKETLRKEKTFWQRITERGNQLYQRHTA
jgi:hypothetical protein